MYDFDEGLDTGDGDLRQNAVAEVHDVTPCRSGRVAGASQTTCNVDQLTPVIGEPSIPTLSCFRTVKGIRK